MENGQKFLSQQKYNKGRRRLHLTESLYIKDFLFLSHKTVLPTVALISNFLSTGCPTYFLPFSKAYILKLVVSRSKIPTVLGVS